MRIIAGRFKGRRLVSFEGKHIRPTTDRVKETIFNKLMHDIGDARVLDLFSGTGNLSLESLSRGAHFVLAVEQHRKSLEIIRRNSKELGVLPEELQIQGQDVFQFLKNYQGDIFQVIIADPPFTQKIAHDVMLAIAQSGVHAEGSLVVIESAKSERIDDSYEPFNLLDRRDFGDKVVSFFRR